jgi:hypothetical protein
MHESRQSGKTTKMLSKAIEEFLKGQNVYVTGWCEWYAIELQQKVALRLQVMNIDYRIKKGKITYNGCYMKFIRHKALNPRGIKSCCIFMDHYRGPGIS